MVKSDANRSQTLREKKTHSGLAEIRGLWAHKQHHARLKLLIGQFISSSHRDEKAIEAAYKRLEDALKAWRVSNPP